MVAPRAVAGPSKRKPRAPHPSNRPAKRTKLPPPLPPKPTSSSHPTAVARNLSAKPSLPIKTGQGLKTRRTDTTKPGFGREDIFVNRSAGLGLLIGRCRSLVMDEGYTRLTLHALSAAIPQALLLLHALLDILPYPVGKRGMWYEIKTGSVECVDEVEKLPSGPGLVRMDRPRKKGVGKEKGSKGKTIQKGADDADVPDEPARLDRTDAFNQYADIGGMEEDEPEIQARILSSITITLHISPRPKASDQAAGAVTPQVDGRPKQARKGEGRRNRPSKKRRQVLLQRRSDKDPAILLPAAGRGDEEMMMNAARGPDGADHEEEEEVEEIEER